MRRSHVPFAALAVGLLVGWIFGGGVANWSAGDEAGPASAEILVGLLTGGVAAVVTWLVLDRLVARRLLDAPKRKAGGVGEESATARPDPGG